MSAPPPVTVQDLTVAYGDAVVQQGVSFEVRRGEIFFILGGSGSGKTTLLRAMIGLLPPLEGRVLVGGDDLAAAQGPERARILRRFGVMFQGGALFGSMTLLENVRLPLDELTALGPRERTLVARAKLNQVGLLDAADKLPAELSGGMRKRAALARAMALDPEILFLDEPSAGLDPVTSAGLDRLVCELSRGGGITLVVVSHELASVDAIADRCVMLDAAARAIIAEGSPTELREHATDPRVRRFFRREADPEGAGGCGP
jgi:phospholipid/cholesterol/gamma-HCH transport system ATP-binding protein